MRAYCDDRAAALALAATLRQENDLLRAENEHLRELIDPGAGRWRGAFAQLSSAIAVTLMLLGAMVGAGVIVEHTASAAEANVSRADDLGARLAVVSPHEVVEAVPPATAAPAPAALPERVCAPAAPHRHHRRHGHHHRRHHRHHHQA
jgi:hypothetical protein